MSSPFVGQIMIFAGNFAPVGWAICDGQLLSVAENEQLFNAIGTTYGGDSVSTFALPDLRGRVPIGQGQGPRSAYQIGHTVGAEGVLLHSAQLPPHSHIVSAVTGPGNSNVPAANTVLSALGGQAESGQFQTPAYAPGTGTPTPLHPATVGASGGSQTHDNMQPYLVFNFCIALSGANP